MQRPRPWLSPFRQTNRGGCWPSCATWWPSACRPKARSTAVSRRAGEAAEKHFAAGQREPTERYQGERAASEAEYAALRGEIVAKFEAEHGAASAQYADDPRRTMARFESAEIAADQERQDAHWEATTIAEAAKGGSGLELADIQAELDARWQELQAIGRQAVELLRRRGQWRHFPDPAFSGSLLERHPAQRFIKAQELAREQYRVWPPRNCRDSSAACGR